MELQNWFVEIWNFLLYVIIVIEGYCNLNLTFRLLSLFLLLLLLLLLLFLNDHKFFICYKLICLTDQT